MLKITFLVLIPQRSQGQGGGVWELSQHQEGEEYNLDKYRTHKHRHMEIACTANIFTYPHAFLETTKHAVMLPILGTMESGEEIRVQIISQLLNSH